MCKQMFSLIKTIMDPDFDKWPFTFKDNLVQFEYTVSKTSEEWNQFVLKNAKALIDIRKKKKFKSGNRMLNIFFSF